MTKIVNKTSKGTAGSSFASAVNFFMIVDQRKNPVFPSFERKQPFLICVKPLFKGKVRICPGGGGGAPQKKGGGKGGLPYKSDGDTHQQVKIKPLKGDQRGCGSCLNWS